MSGRAPRNDYGTTFPEDFLPNENNRQNAERWGLNLADQAEAFAEYHQSKGNRFVKWNLALNTWMRNAYERKIRYHPVDPPKIAAPTPTAPPPEFIDAHRRYKQKQAQGSLQWNLKG